jgi:preprotein translocase subunit YajC
MDVTVLLLMVLFFNFFFFLELGRKRTTQTELNQLRKK